MAEEETNLDNEVDEKEEFDPNLNIALHCVLKGDLERLIQCFENEEDPYKELILEAINERDEEGKSPLDMASILGRVEMIVELLNRGSEVNSTTEKGYTALHRAAAWGKVDCLKVLVENHADVQQKTNTGERAREMAVRYNQTECVDYLDWAEAKQALVDCITNMRETIADPEKVQGRLNRDDKNLCTNTCNEKQQWIDGTMDATTNDFIMQKQELEATFEPIWTKLSEPLPEKPEKK